MSEIEAFPSLAKILINIILPKDVEHIKGFGQICFSSFKHNVFSGCLTKDWILLPVAVGHLCSLKKSILGGLIDA